MVGEGVGGVARECVVLDARLEDEGAVLGRRWGRGGTVEADFGDGSGSMEPRCRLLFLRGQIGLGTARRTLEGEAKQRDGGGGRRRRGRGRRGGQRGGHGRSLS